jgi:hypothetical protein
MTPRAAVNVPEDVSVGRFWVITKGDYREGLIQPFDGIYWPNLRLQIGRHEESRQAEEYLRITLGNSY